MDFKSMTAADIMQRDVIKVFSDTSLMELAKLLKEKKITGVPVVDRSNKLAGVVSSTDVIRFYATQSKSQKAVSPAENTPSEEAPAGDHVLQAAMNDFGQVKVEEIMTRETFTLMERTLITVMAKRMVEQHMHRVIIVDEDLNLAGVVSSMDLVRLFADLDD